MSVSLKIIAALLLISSLVVASALVVHMNDDNGAIQSAKLSVKNTNLTAQHNAVAATAVVTSPTSASAEDNWLSRLTKQPSNLSIFLVLLALITVTVFGALFYRLITIRLRQLNAVVQALSEGKLSTRANITGDDEFQSLALLLNSMAAALEDKQLSLENKILKLEKTIQHKSDFLACMSHEIRTPMNGVLGMLGLLKKEGLSDAQFHKVNLAHNSASALLAIINDILDFSKIEAGKLELETIDFNLLDLVGEFCESIKPRAYEKGLELVFDFSDMSESSVKADPGRILQILNNLAGNAIKFTNQGEVLIKIALKENSDNSLSFICSVSDTGVGIDTDRQGHIFDSFTQEDVSTARHFGGTGLGLAIVKQLCEMMQGGITVESELGKGSTFEVSLTVNRAAQAQLVDLSSDIRDVHVLIVDDNRTNGETLCRQLSVWSEHVDVVYNGLSALDRLQKKNYDIAFIDLNMPSMDGLQLAYSIRRKGLDQIKLIVMNALVDQYEVNRFMEAGFDEYLVKPITLKDMDKSFSLLDQASEKEGLTEVQESATPTFSSDYRLLLVEDNIINQEVINGVLGHFGLAGDIAGSGVEALNVLRKTSDGPLYDLIVMDCQMPEMDGFQATRAIRAGKAGEHYKNIPIVAMTANAMKGDRERCLQSGMDDYLSKPVDGILLAQTLEKWLPQTDAEGKLGLN